MKAYAIVDIWKINIEEYEGRQKQSLPNQKVGKNTTRKVGKNSATNNNQQSNDNTTSIAPTEPIKYDFKETLERWERGKVRKFDILAWYIKKVGLVARSKAELDNIVRRHIKAASRLEAYTDEELVAAARKAAALSEKLQFDWTLDTVLKQLTQ